MRTATPVETPGRLVEHTFVAVTADDKLDRLVEQLSGERGLALVFVRTKYGADKLARKLLRQHDVSSAAMHGNMSQNARERTLAHFQSGRVTTLVATDLAARGLDVDDITHVINYDPPAGPDDYVHRVGRTGRAGRSGHRRDARPPRAAPRRRPDRRAPRPRRRLRRIGDGPRRAALPAGRRRAAPPPPPHVGSARDVASAGLGGPPLDRRPPSAASAPGGGAQRPAGRTASPSAAAARTSGRTTFGSRAASSTSFARWNESVDSAPSLRFASSAPRPSLQPPVAKS